MSFFYFKKKIEKLIQLNYEYTIKSSPKPKYIRIAKNINKLLNDRNIRRYIVEFRDFNVKFHDLYHNFMDTIYDCCNLKLWLRLCKINLDFVKYVNTEERRRRYYKIQYIALMGSVEFFNKLEYNSKFYYFILCYNYMNKPMIIDLIKVIYKYYGYHTINIDEEHNILLNIIYRLKYTTVGLNFNHPVSNINFCSRNTQ